MDIVVKWVTQIILFLLLALVTDLLLPTSSMKKYIKLVVGMLLILVFLQPLFQLFHVDINYFFDRQMAALEQSVDTPAMKNSIESKKKEIQASQRAYILEQMGVQLKNQVEEELISKYGVTINDFSYQFKEGKEMSLETLEQLTVFLTQTTQTTGKKDEDKVEEVKEVDINIADKQQAQTESSPSLTDIKKLLSSSWEIPEEKLLLKWEGGQ